MNIRSISELEEKIQHVKRYVQILNSYIELSIKDETGKFISKKLDFGKYTESAVNEFFTYIDYFDHMCEVFKNMLDGIVDEVDRRIHQQNLLMDEFMYKAHNQLVHKLSDWHYSTEVIHNNKNFLGYVHIYGEDSLLTSDTVMYQTTRATYNYIDGESFTYSKPNYPDPLQPNTFSFQLKAESSNKKTASSRKTKKKSKS